MILWIAASLEQIFNFFAAQQDEERGMVRGMVPGVQGTDASQMTAPPTSPQTFQIQCPEGAGPGAVLAVPIPDGGTQQVTVPAGITVGQNFTVTVEVAPPTPMLPVSTAMAPVAPAATVALQIQCPEGAGPGAVLAVPAPDGVTHQVTVPEGVVPGASFTVEVPAARPTLNPDGTPIRFDP